MMRYYQGDIVDYFDLLKDSNVNRTVLVHGCNCAGHFNSGLAKQIRLKYPVVYEEYLNFVKQHNPRLLGQINPVSVGETGIIVNAFTQQYYGTNPNTVYVNYKAIQSVMDKIKLQYPDRQIVLPKIGAGLGNGDWSIISDLIEKSLNNVFYFVFNYRGV